MWYGNKVLINTHPKQTFFFPFLSGEGVGYDSTLGELESLFLLQVARAGVPRSATLPPCADHGYALWSSIHIPSLFAWLDT